MFNSHLYNNRVVETSKAGPTVPGELTVYDLPPLEDLKIALDEKVTLNVIGTVDSIVDCLGKASVSTYQFS